MKKALLVVVALALVAWVASWFWSEDAVAVSAAQPWPGGLGTLESVESRFPPQQGNDASRRLAALAGALTKDETVTGFVVREIARGESTIGEPPALPDVSAIRDLLLRETIVWQRYRGFDDPEVGKRRVLQMSVARTLVASALTRARANDPAAWDDLHAVWRLARTLDGHPQTMMQTAAFSMARMINAVAWKLPLPAPAWLGELEEHDPLPALLAAFQYQTASYWDGGARMFPTKWLANSVAHDRLIAVELSGLRGCDVTMRANELGVDLSSVWRRVFRYRAEREAAANALRIREGKPIETGSRCSDGAWTFDGTTLRFSREIVTTAQDIAMPLVLRVERQAAESRSTP